VGRRHLDYFNKCNRKVCSQTLTFVGVLKACASMVAIEEGRCVHWDIIRSSLESDVFVGSSLVSIYAKCGSMEDAWRAFNKSFSENNVL
jgi:pentatricopeptide repeat protein